jgi:tRNA(Arg) A34 adenosine deaminase TadA
MENEAESSTPGLAITNSPAHQFKLYGWRPDPELSADENYLDVVMLITRSVQGDGQQGHMGALIVRASESSTSDEATSSDPSSCTTTASFESKFFRNIIGAATNTPLFGGKDVTSDIHAEINALGQVCRASQSSEGCTAYITIHPCKRCFAALVTFGIRRIVCRRESPPLIVETAAEHNISVSHLSYDQQRRQIQRINHLVNQEFTTEQLQEIAENVKQQRKERKMADKGRKKKNGQAENAKAAENNAVANMSASMSVSQRRLWLSPEDLDNLSNNGAHQQATDDSYDSLFEKFSSRPERKPLTLYLWNTLSVGQEFVLTCMLLAGHRAAMMEERHFQRLQQQYTQSSNEIPFSVQSDRLWIALALVWSTLVISVIQTRFATSQQYQLRHRLTDFSLMAILLRFLSAVLRSLTASYSSDTVYALSIGTLFLHLLACNYSYANGWSDDDHSEDAELASKRLTTRKRPLFKGGTLSLTSVFFATTLLASRLQNNITVYIFVCFSVVLFALYPAARHLVAASNTTIVPILITGILTSALLLLLEDEKEVMLVVATLSLILFFVPLWKHHLQQYKVLLRGPWDIAHV